VWVLPSRLILFDLTFSLVPGMGTTFKWSQAGTLNFRSFSELFDIVNLAAQVYVSVVTKGTCVPT
jgi:hypothetical protein